MDVFGNALQSGHQSIEVLWEFRAFVFRASKASQCLMNMYCCSLESEWSPEKT